MAGSFKGRITRSMTANKRRAAKTTVAAPAGEEFLPKRRQHVPMEKRALKPRTTKREEAAGKKMTRLPQAEIDSILATAMDDDRLPPDFRALKRHSPDLTPSPEEETDEELVSFYDLAREFYAVGEEFREFQAWVRSDYAKNGYVEVDDDFLANRTEGRAIIEAERREALRCFDFSDLID